MLQYAVRSGQNIYDVALTLYGSVEGIFDLLASNEWLNMETPLSYGMVLNYHEEFIINNTIRIWLKENEVIVKNGEHVHNYLDVENIIKYHFESDHPDIVDSLQPLSTDEKNIFWEGIYTPRMVILHQGALSTINLVLKEETHLIVDWGDYSAPQIIEGDEYQEIEHCYKGTGRHTITLYGDYRFSLLDFSELNGIYYPMDEIISDEFISNLDSETLQQLIVTQ